MSRLVLLFALISTLVLSAQTQWTYIPSENFELYSSAEPKRARELVEYLEQGRDFFMRAKSSEVTTRLPVTIVAFKSAAEYRPYAPRESAAAYYLGDRDRDYIVMSGVERDKFPMAVHEYVHLLVRHSEMNLPPWLNEGLAELYSTLEPRAGKVLVGLVPQDRARTLKSDQWLPMKRLLAVNQGSPEYTERQRAGIFYAQSWLLVHMLMLDDYTREGFPKFVEIVSSGVPVERAFEQVWHLPVEYAEKKLQGYSRYVTFSGVWYDLKLQKFEGLEPRPAEPVDVAITLASLDGALGREAESARRLAVLEEKHADYWRLQEALGTAAWRKGDISAARSHFRRATELRAPNWRTWMNYAQLIHGLADDYETAIKVLRRVLELNAEHPEARIMLAEEYGFASRYKDAVTVLKDAKGLQPSLAPRLFLALANAHAHLGNENEAREAAERARAVATNSSELGRVEEILRFVNLRGMPRPPVLTPPATVGGAAAPRRPTEKRETVTGAFKEFECLGASARIAVGTERGLVRFVVRDPSRIAIQGKNGAMTMSCGKQAAGRTITVEYVAGTNEVRSLAFP